MRLAGTPNRASGTRWVRPHAESAGRRTRNTLCAYPQIPCCRLYRTGIPGWRSRTGAFEGPPAGR